MTIPWPTRHVRREVGVRPTLMTAELASEIRRPIFEREGLLLEVRTELRSINEDFSIAPPFRGSADCGDNESQPLV